MPSHLSFRKKLVKGLASDARFEAVLGAGSMIAPGMDRFSDLDLVVVVQAADYQTVMAERRAFAESLGDLLAAFTGEHVGEPRLLICLYRDADLGLLHVDLKFVTLDDLDSRVETPVILWARDPAFIETRLGAGEVSWPNRPPDWFEQRLWTWLHYAAAKLHRGELWEAIASLAFIREQVLGPLLHRRHDRDQRGLRRIESLPPEANTSLERTLAVHDANSVRVALRATAELYLDLRGDEPPERPVADMPNLFYTYLEHGGD